MIHLQSYICCTHPPIPWSCDCILGAWQLVHVLTNCSVPQSHDHDLLPFCHFLAENSKKHILDMLDLLIEHLIHFITSEKKIVKLSLVT